MPDVVIRRADSVKDAAVVLEFIEQLADFEKLTPPDEAARSRFIEDGFVREPPRFEVWLAEYEGQSAGYALIFETYSSCLCRPTLYLEDLYVAPEFRRLGLGTKLLSHCKLLAQQRGCGRMEWTCLDWNVRAQAVYVAMGAERMQEWLLYRLTGEALQNSA